MRHRFFDLAFTPTVQAEQARPALALVLVTLPYRRAEAMARRQDVLEEQGFAFIAERDSFYLATVSETGWPYVQHRGGPVGFVRRVDEQNHRVGRVYSGNRQYVSGAEQRCRGRSRCDDLR